ncbi:MAG: NFACT family protein [Eubacterium sp.]
MALDGIYLHLLKKEITQKLLGFRVDKIYQPSREEILFTFRTFDGVQKLLLSAKADCPVIQLTQQHIENRQTLHTHNALQALAAQNVDIKQDGFEE